MFVAVIYCEYIVWLLWSCLPLIREIWIDDWMFCSITNRKHKNNNFSVSHSSDVINYTTKCVWLEEGGNVHRWKFNKEKKAAAEAAGFRLESETLPRGINHFTAALSGRPSWSTGVQCEGSGVKEIVHLWKTCVLSGNKLKKDGLQRLRQRSWDFGLLPLFSGCRSPSPSPPLLLSLLHN